MVLKLRAKSDPLKVIKTGGALDISEGIGRCALKPLEKLAADKSPFELTNKLLEVILKDSEERYELEVDIVKDFDLRGLFHEEDGCGPAKGLNIAGVRGKKWKDVFREAALAAYPRNDRIQKAPP